MSDYELVQAALDDLETTGHLNLPPRYYYIDQPLTLLPATAHGTFHADFRGATLVNRCAPGSAVLQVGSAELDRKWHSSTISNLQVRTDGGPRPEGCIGLDVQHFDHGTIRDSVVAVAGDDTIGIRIGVGTCNSLNLRNVSTAGSTVGISAKGQNGLLSIEGGKVQQHAIGLDVSRSMMAHIKGVDFSLCESPVLLHECSLFEVQAYFERCGTGAGGDASTLIELIRCNSGLIRRTWLNCAHGSANGGRHTGYGVRLTDCHDVRIEDSVGNFASHAYASADDDCKRITVCGLTLREGHEWYGGTPTPVDGPVTIEDEFTPPGADRPSHLGLDWDELEGATLDGKLLTLPRTSGPNSAIRTTATTTGRGVSFMARLSLERIISDEFGTNMAGVRLYCYGANGGPYLVTDFCRLGSNPKWVHVSDPDADPNDWTLTIEARQAKEPCVVRVHDIRLVEGGST